jgi:Flp pilus assembly protein TadD
LGDASVAVAALDRAVGAQPLFQEAHVKRGEALAELGRGREAIAAFRQAVDLAPERSPVAWNNLGFELLKTQRSGEAQDAFRRALALDADFVTARVNLASALLLDNRPADAIPELEQALDLEPEETSALGNLGVAYARTGRIDEARASFMRLLAIDPRDGQARAYLAELERMPAAGPLR